MRSFLALLLVVPIVALVPPASSDAHGLCTGPWPATGEMEFYAIAGPIFYVDDRNYLTGNSIWIYEETNGLWKGEGPAVDLQRGGESAYIPGDREICYDDSTVGPDLLIF